MFKCMSPWGTFFIQAKAALMCQFSTGLADQTVFGEMTRL